MVSLLKIALNTHHICHPCNNNKKHYQKWQTAGIFAFAAVAILTGGIAALILLTTAAFKNCKKVSSLSKTDQKSQSVGKSLVVPSKSAVAKAEKLCQQGADFLFYKKDRDSAEKCLLEAADLGNVRAKALLGLLYSFKNDEDASFKCFYEAAHDGDAEAQFHLAMAYQEGKGIAVDLHQALFWYTKSYETEPRFMAGEANDKRIILEKLLQSYS